MQGGSANFHLFGPVHLAIAGGILGLAAGLAALARRVPIWRRRIRFAVAAALLINAAIWYGYEATHGLLKYPAGLPLELCDATLTVTVIASFTLSPAAFDLAYYGALAGTSMAVLTPDLWEPFPSFGTVQFFIAHGLVIVAVLFMAWSREARPRPGSVWRAMLGLNIFAAFVGAFDFAFRTNYMYLRSNPPTLRCSTIWVPGRGISLSRKSWRWRSFRCYLPYARTSARRVHP